MTESYWFPRRELGLPEGDVDDAFAAWGRGHEADFPPVNVWTSDEGAVVTAELPGIEATKLDISVLGDTITLKGDRQKPNLEEGHTFHRRERGFGRFSRTVQLPFRVDDSKVQAKYEHGVVRILAPWATGSRPRSISVSTGQ